MSRSSAVRRHRPARALAIATALALGLAAPLLVAPQTAHAAGISFTVLHTNDFHGQLELNGSNPGAARVADKITAVRSGLGAANVLTFDAGDMMQGSLLSNLQKGLPTIDYYRTIGYDAATFGNHEFDWGQEALGHRIAQAESPATPDEHPVRTVSANITKKVAGECTWTPFNAGVAPYEVFTVGTAPNTVRVGVIGVTTTETPTITVAAATEGLCFRDPAESIAHHFGALDTASDVIVVLSHLGHVDGGYGYGIPVYGDQTLAKKLNDAGTPVALIIGGHSHSDLAAAVDVGGITVVQASYNGRRVGRADVVYNPLDGSASVTWSRIVVGTSDTENAAVKGVVQGYATDPAYLATVNQPVGYTQVDLSRDYNGDSMMGDFVDDAVYGALNSDASRANDVDLVLNNPGGLRTDWCDLESPPASGTWVWTSTPANCQAAGLWTHDPMLVTYGQMFTILPFGNQTIVGSMTGAQLIDLVHQSATLSKGALQTSHLRYRFFRYSDGLPGPQPYAWGAYRVEVRGADTKWVPVDPAKTYRVATNEFLAPAGGDNFQAFKYMTDISYWGDMLDLVNAYVTEHFGTSMTPYRGPNSNGTLDQRIQRNGDGDDTYDAGEIVPVTILHHNDPHGRLLKSGSVVGYTQLATLITQERAHNAGRTLLVNAGDILQGDLLTYYFRAAGLGFGADGSPLPAALRVNPVVAAYNAVGYDAVVVGNHDFDYGKDVFATLNDATFPVLAANVTDDGRYGVAAAGVATSVTRTVGPEGIKVAILGITNHRVASAYQLAPNVTGLTFADPITTAAGLVPALRAGNDAVIAVTHIGAAADPKSAEVDDRVDAVLAQQVPGLDAVVGGHSHTDPANPNVGGYRYLPALVADPDHNAVPVSQAYRYNTVLGEIVLGMNPTGGGGYQVVSRTGRYVPVASAVAEDPTVASIVQPYQNLLNAYQAADVGKTTAPLDTLQAFTQETNGADLQSDAAVARLEADGIPVDLHLAGAVANRSVAAGATPATPASLTVNDMVTLMPYDNALTVLAMNGPQLKAVLERSYRNYYHYKYVPGYGGYSYYPTCMLVPDSNGKVHYRDTYPSLPDGNNVAGLTIGGTAVDFTDASTYYRVSTVDYLARGSCNFSDAGTSLWPTSTIVAATQRYVRDAVIDLVRAQAQPISPAIAGRLDFAAPAGPSVVTPVVSPEPSAPGQPVTATATVTVPGSALGPATCDVTFGDGTPRLAGTMNGSTCTSPPHVFAAPGNYPVTVRVRDRLLQPGTATTTHVVRTPSPPPPAPDTVAPTLSVAAMPTVSLLPPLLRWTAADDTALAAFSLRTRLTSPAGLVGAWSPARTLPASARSLALALPRTGGTLCAALTALDTSGNRSAAVTRCTAVPTDDRALVAGRGSAWARAAVRTAFRGTLSVSRTRGSTLTLAKARGSSLVLVVTKGPGGGTVGVYVKGTRVAVVSLTARRIATKAQVPVSVRGGLRGVPVTLRVEAPGRGVWVDGLAVR